MKKIALFITALTVSLSLGGKALADTNTATFADKAGITPDNVILYPIDKALDNLKINTASSDDKKAEALAEVAEERLGESEVMADKEKTDLSNQTLKEYSDKMTEAQEKVEDAIDKATDSTTTDSAIKLDELKKEETSISDRQMKSIEVLKNIESKVSGNAKETIAKVIEMQTAKKEAIIAVNKEREALIKDKQAVKDAEKKIEQAKKSGNEQDIKTAEDKLKQSQEALNIQKEKFNQVVAAKKEVMKIGVGQLKKQLKNELKEEVKNGNITKEEAKDALKAVNNKKEETNSNVSNSTANVVETKTSNDADDNSSSISKHGKSEKENKGEEMKANKEKKAEKENKSRHEN
ncbi:DUF5667 domain-containing protein [Clostridium sp. OS1-26]|uniref:DUF5667 domain-containing protein n=1 Tax=Clostridium sp. OS1-26 TaxID=3070681 RepID=UPI0027DEB9C9|nr:DUF5667 domain-containing protein [Clostridium sp. OS1-26]WML36837.1 DUF5667 domain-containing protein [Clostridium sp. OS1-26]